MFGFLIGWGVFWVIIWGCLLGIFASDKFPTRGTQDMVAITAIGLAISIIYLIACFVGHIV